MLDKKDSTDDSRSMKFVYGQPVTLHQLQNLTQLFKIQNSVVKISKENRDIALAKVLEQHQIHE